jgi:membrane protein YdbS with pleckstrin-like domain
MSTSISDGEEILWSGSISHWHYAGKWFFVLVCLAALAATFVLVFVEDQTTLWVIRGVLALIAIALLVWIYADRAAHKYIVTSKRVTVEFGVISKQSNELRIQDIRSINLTTKGLSGLAGIGRVEFSSAATDDADVIFWNTPRAEKIRDLVRSLQSAVPSTQ